jgi:hypothetical protein
LFCKTGFAASMPQTRFRSAGGVFASLTLN